MAEPPSPPAEPAPPAARRHPRPPSLALRVTVLFGILAVLVFTSLGWFIDRSIEHHFTVGDDTELELIADSIADAVGTSASNAYPQQLSRRLQDILVGHHGAILYLAEPGGKTLFSNFSGGDQAALIDDLRNLPVNTIMNWHSGKHAYRLLIRRIDQPAGQGKLSYTMAAAVTLEYHQRFLSSFRRTLWTIIAGGTVVLSLMGWFAVRQGHAPLRKIVDQISRISADELNIRLRPDAVPLELRNLAKAFNDMLQRMEEAFQRLSNFSADIAHELRTPVTNLLTQTQVCLTQSRNEHEYREILYSNMEEYERMAQLIADMLFLAKADNGLYHPEHVEIHLEHEVRALFEYYEAWAEEQGVSLVLEGRATTRGDRRLLRSALSNLLTNAIRHTPAGGAVKVTLAQTAEQSVVVHVENPGLPIPKEHLPRIFDRFYRVDPARHRGDGTGLGLAIARSIVDLHAGTIAVTSDEHVTRFSVTLPTHPDARH